MVFPRVRDVHDGRATTSDFRSIRRAPGRTLPTRRSPHHLPRPLQGLRNKRRMLVSYRPLALGALKLCRLATQLDSHRRQPSSRSSSSSSTCTNTWSKKQALQTKTESSHAHHHPQRRDVRAAPCRSQRSARRGGCAVVLSPVAIERTSHARDGRDRPRRCGGMA